MTTDAERLVAMEQALKAVEQRLETAEARTSEALEKGEALERRAPAPDLIAEAVELALVAKERGEGGAFEAGGLEVTVEPGGVMLRRKLS